MQSKRPRFNPLILALALAAVLMVWSVLGGTGAASSSSMEYSTVVHYFESLQVTQFSLDLNTGVITMNLKEGGKNNLPLPDTTSQSTTQATGGLLSGMLSSSDEDTAAQKNSDGTVTVRYKLPYASMFVKYVGDYIAAYDAANPDAPMVYDYTPVKESIPWMEILFYLAMLGCTGFLLFSMMRGGAGGGGIMNVGKAKVKDEHENQKTATFADVAGEDEEKEELAEIVKLAERPFIVKGVMTVKGALKAREAGAAAIVVSNHGGRVLDQCPATAEVLPEIAAALKGTGVKILVDGGIRTGVDVFKALALGADGVLICRPFVTAVYGGGEEGVKCYIDKLAGELADTMQMCGAHSLAEITPDMVRV